MEKMAGGESVCPKMVNDKSLVNLSSPVVKSFNFSLGTPKQFILSSLFIILSTGISVHFWSEQMKNFATLMDLICSLQMYITSHK